MNYVQSYAPPYAQYAAPYAPQYAMAPYAEPSLAATGEEKPPADGTKEPGVTTAEFWKKDGPLRIPRWALALGVVSLGTIGYGWQAGWFDGGSRVSAKRTTSVSRRDPGRRKKKAVRRSSKKSRGHRYDFDF